MTDLTQLFGLRLIEGMTDRRTLPSCLEVRCEECGRFGTAYQQVGVAGGYFRMPVSLLCLDCFLADGVD